jgi:tetratricopeptide (TPR) repeat protein
MRRCMLVLLIVLLGAGLVSAAAGEKPATLRDLKQAVRTNPKDPGARYSLGEKYESLGDAKKAIREYKMVLSLKPGDEKALTRLAGVVGELGQTDKAIELLTKAVKLKPNSQEARKQLAAAYNKQGIGFIARGDLDAAREALEAGIKTDGGAAETEALRNNLGCLYVRENRLDQATETFREVLRQNPEVPQAHYNLALIYYAQGDYQAADRQFYSLKGVDRNLAEDLSDYRFRITTSTEVSPPVKSPGFKGSPLLIQGPKLSSYSR